MTQKSFAEQNKLLKKHLGLTVKVPTDKEISRDYPKHQYPLYLVPAWQRAADTYPEAVQKALDALKKRDGDKFVNWREGEIDAKHLRRIPSSQLPEVLHAQLGEKYMGKSVDSARADIVKNGEYALGAWEILVIYLTHPELLISGKWYGIDCPADEWSWNADGVFSRAPYVYCFDGEAEFDTGSCGFTSDSFGSASVVPQQQKLESGSLGAFAPLTLEAAVARVRKEGYVIYKPI